MPLRTKKIIMANLAIKGHPTRGKEVIEILEMLGGKNKYHFMGNEDEWYVLNGNIQRTDRLFAEKGFTLEEFFEKYPYKVGDKVIVKGLSEYPKIIRYMKWFDGNVHYSFDNETWFLPSALNPYKEETMEEKLCIGLFPVSNGRKEIIPCDGYEVVSDEGKFYVVKKQPQYPKTYADCAEVMGWASAYIDGYNGKLLKCLQKLLICRDAYWKIAWDWKPEFRVGKKKYCIMTEDNRVINATVEESNRILTFPTEEIRDTFYDNFKELIEECKELL